MCTRFTTVRVNVTGSSNDVVESAGQYIGLVPVGTTSPVGYWHIADIAVEAADLTVAGRTGEPHVSALTLGVEAL